MKGIVFTEFVQMVEAQLGMAACEHLVEAAQLASGGAYTTVGTYDHAELMALVAQLARISGTPASTLVREFGEHLFGRFSVLFPQFFVDVNSTLDFLERVDAVIHQEVRKLYPDAELPRFGFERIDPDRMRLVYHSARPLADLAEGLMLGCARYFRETIHVRRETLTSGEGTTIRFEVTCQTRSTHAMS